MHFPLPHLSSATVYLDYLLSGLGWLLLHEKCHSAESTQENELCLQQNLVSTSFPRVSITAWPFRRVLLKPHSAVYSSLNQPCIEEADFPVSPSLAFSTGLLLVTASGKFWVTMVTQAHLLPGGHKGWFTFGEEQIQRPTKELRQKIGRVQS